MKDSISKENYILEAYSILSTEGIKAVTIRRLADTLGCNSANLYHYFDRLEELIIFASLRYLKSYISEVRELYEMATDNLKLHFSVWECFSRYTFSYPEIFNNLFWGKYSSKLDHIIREYKSFAGWPKHFTHVLVGDATRGYGILIENMLDAALWEGGTEQSA